MFAQEKSNKFLFQARQVAPDTTDVDREMDHTEGAASSSRDGAIPLHDFVMEEAEEETPENDALVHIDPASKEGELVRIIRHLRAQVNQAIAHEHFEDAADIQKTLTTVLDSAQCNPALTMELARQVAGVYQRLFRRARNRGNNALAEIYHGYVEDLYSHL